jgi:hypothetical protein
MSIVGVVLLTVLLDIFMSEGETKKYTRGILSLFIVATIIAPLPRMLSTGFEWNYAPAVSTPAPEVDLGFVESVNLARLRETELRIQRELADAGLQNVLVRTDVHFNGAYVRVNSVHADIKNLVITDAAANININVKIKATVRKHLSITEDLIVINGN